MLKITLEVFTTLKERLGWSKKELIIDASESATLKDVLDAVPELKSLIVEQDLLKKGFIILINGRHAEFLGGLHAIVRDGDTVDVFPQSGGG
ncbi:MAG: MoaD/ThiS family protein [Desulfurococcaceae archaeon]|jgi:molybdopterin converting factor small subunit|nr:MoaD/ThiS family protein [Desulfurococcaceae archaeon]